MHCWSYPTDQHDGAHDKAEAEGQGGDGVAVVRLPDAVVRTGEASVRGRGPQLHRQYRKSLCRTEQSEIGERNN